MQKDFGDSPVSLPGVISNSRPGFFCRRLFAFPRSTINL